MLELSDAARKELESFFAAKPEEERNIRIYQAFSCSGPMLNIALDTPNENDATETVHGFTFCIDKELLDTIKSAKIDISYMGFLVEPEVALPVPEGGGCASCGGACH